MQGKTVGDLMNAEKGHDRYNLLGDNCKDAKARVMDQATKEKEWIYNYNVNNK